MAPVYSQTHTQSLFGPLDNTCPFTSGSVFPTAGLPSPETLNTMSVSLPLVAFPFLPSEPDYYARGLLVWSECLSLLVHLFDLFSRPFGKSTLHTQFWVLPVAFFSALLASTKPRRDGDALQPSDFAEPAEYAFAIIIYQLIMQVLLFMDELPVSLITYLLLALLWDTIVACAGIMAFPILTGSLRLAFYQFATRRVSWWYWLPQSEEDEDFQPRWSLILGVLTLIAPPIICYYTVLGLDNRELGTT